MRNKMFSILALIAFVLCAQISVLATSGGVHFGQILR